jgi:hypothetical protein
MSAKTLIVLYSIIEQAVSSEYRFLLVLGCARFDFSLSDYTN